MKQFTARPFTRRRLFFTTIQRLVERHRDERRIRVRTGLRISSPIHIREPPIEVRDPNTRSLRTEDHRHTRPRHTQSTPTRRFDFIDRHTRSTLRDTHRDPHQRRGIRRSDPPNFTRHNPATIRHHTPRTTSRNQTHRQPINNNNRTHVQPPTTIEHIKIQPTRPTRRQISRPEIPKHIPTRLRRQTTRQRHTTTKHTTHQHTTNNHTHTPHQPHPNTHHHRPPNPRPTTTPTTRPPTTNRPRPTLTDRFPFIPTVDLRLARTLPFPFFFPFFFFDRFALLCLTAGSATGGKSQHPGTSRSRVANSSFSKEHPDSPSQHTTVQKPVPHHPPAHRTY